MEKISGTDRVKTKKALPTVKEEMNIRILSNVKRYSGVFRGKKQETEELHFCTH
jgi:hypothetical protein